MYTAIDEVKDEPLRRCLAGWSDALKGVTVGGYTIVVGWKSKRKFDAHQDRLSVFLQRFGFATVLHEYQGRVLEEYTPYCADTQSRPRHLY